MAKVVLWDEIIVECYNNIYNMFYTDSKHEEIALKMEGDSISEFWSKASLHLKS